MELARYIFIALMGAIAPPAKTINGMVSCEKMQERAHKYEHTDHTQERCCNAT
jgi:hypothetical protein